jgi:hypothetical protein
MRWKLSPIKNAENIIDKGVTCCTRSHGERQTSVTIHMIENHLIRTCALNVTTAWEICKNYLRNQKLKSLDFENAEAIGRMFNTPGSLCVCEIRNREQQPNSNSMGQ